MILTINFRDLRNAEFLQLCKDILTIVQLNGAPALLVLPHWNAFAARIAEIETLFMTDTGSNITGTISNLDLRRDDAITGLGKIIDAYTFHYDTAMRSAARLLQDNLALYSSATISRQNYQAETATIANVVADWTNKPELAAAAATLSLNGWKTELSAANADFNTQYIARTMQMASVSPDTIRQKRQEATDAWYHMRNFIDYYYQANNGANPWAKASNELNTLIEQYNVLLAGRIGGSEEETPAAPVI